MYSSGFCSSFGVIQGDQLLSSKTKKRSQCQEEVVGMSMGLSHTQCSRCDLLFCSKCLFGVPVWAMFLFEQKMKASGVPFTPSLSKQWWFKHKVLGRSSKGAAEVVHPFSNAGLWPERWEWLGISRALQWK